jgi:hypothetical protein
VLITDQYKAQQEQLHENEYYWTASTFYAPLVSEIVNKLGVSHLLDYGAGKCRLFQGLKADHPMKLQAYDPAVTKYSAPPVPAEMVTCIDVLEHIEPELLDNVLDDLVRVTEVVGFFTITTRAAKKTLPDGRNAHLIQQPMEWWLPKLWERFDIHTVQITAEHSFYVICYAKPKLIEH